MNFSNPCSVEIVSLDNRQYCPSISPTGIAVLCECEAKYRNFLENLPVMLYAAEPQPPFKTIYISPEFKAFGYPLEQWHSKTDMWMSVTHPDDRERVMSETEAALKAGRDTDSEYRIIGRDGTIHWVRDCGRFVTGDCGRIIRWQGVILDVTKRKQMETALTESEERYRSVVAAMSEGIVLQGADGKILACNASAERILGLSADQMAGLTSFDPRWRTVREDGTPFPGEEHVSTLTLQTGKPFRNVLMGVHRADNSLVWISINSQPLFKSGEEKPYAVVTSFLDVSESKRMEEALRASEIQQRHIADQQAAILNALPAHVALLDRDGTIVSVNNIWSQFASANGYRENNPGVGVNYLKICDAATGDCSAQAFAVSAGIRKVLTGELVDFELEYPCHSPTEKRWFRIIVTPYKFEELSGAVVTHINITEKKLAEESLKESEAKFRDLFENANDLIYTHDLKGNFTSLNRAGEIITGYTRDEALNLNIAQVVAPEYLASAREMISRKIAGGEQTTYELEIIAKDKRRVTLELSTRIIYQDQKPIGVQGIARDISARRRAEKELIYNAFHDPLTNLPNRASFMSYLTLANERANRAPADRFAVLFLDVDRFKIINDGLGHIIGDKLLVAIAERLKKCVRPGDLVARFGGDEFTILLDNVKQNDDAIRIAERVQRELSQPFWLDKHEVFTSASIGIIVSDEICRKPEEFLRDADTAMYRAKETGKARYEIFDREMHVRNMTRLKIETDLRRAVERNEFRVFYQPIVSIRTGQILEFEALVRWQHPEYGLIAPDEFISVAEETGLIVPMGEWVLQEACRQAREWHRLFPAKHDRLSVSVNISAKQLMNAGLTKQVKDILAQTKLDARFLKLEVTESMVMEQAENALSVLSELRTLGISLSTDDFGTGYSSLSYLHRFPFNRLKIDRSFVQKMDSDPKSGEIVRTILMLSKSLNMETVAEGIETEKQLNQLQRLGCKYGQGFFFSKPIDAASATTLLR
jgi:diguanylate cyclase (GGDEF)-like protein/PAS domain S-box-containing protein